MGTVEVYSTYPDIQTERNSYTGKTTVFGRSSDFTLLNFATTRINDREITYTLYDPKAILSRLRQLEGFLRKEYGLAPELPILIHYNRGLRVINYDIAEKAIKTGNEVITRLVKLLREAGCTGSVLGKGSLGHGLVAETTDVDIVAIVSRPKRTGIEYSYFSEDDANDILNELARSLGLYKASVMYGFK